MTVATGKMGVVRDSTGEFRYEYSDNFPALLAAVRAALLVSTYQAGKLMLIRPDDGRLALGLQSYDRPMGVAIDEGRIAVGTRSQVWHLHGGSNVTGETDPAGGDDPRFQPRASQVTGDVRGHELAWIDGELWLVNTRFSCLGTVDERSGFVPRWRPGFISALAADDRCHLNGLAVVDGHIRYVTAHGRSDEPEGWRAGKNDGGVLIDVPSGQIVTDGLSMPHSPRVHDGRLWLLNSGRGELVTVDPDSGAVETVTRLPGYTRGLAFCGDLAFVGLSRIRQTATFGGVPIAEQLDQRRCGVHVVDIRSCATVACLEFQTGCEELFDVRALPRIESTG